jgi:hypothetical protein
MLEQKERQKERKNSIEKHHENADFFFNLDKMIADPAHSLAATMSDLVEDLELAKKMCSPSKMDELFNTLRKLNEKMYIYEETGMFGDEKTDDENTGSINDKLKI